MNAEDLTSEQVVREVSFNLNKVQDNNNGMVVYLPGCECHICPSLYLDYFKPCYKQDVCTASAPYFVGKSLIIFY